VKIRELMMQIRDDLDYRIALFGDDGVTDYNGLAIVATSDGYRSMTTLNLEKPDLTSAYRQLREIFEVAVARDLEKTDVLPTVVK